MPDEQKLAELITAAKDIIIIQADNPDGDSLGSAIALEQILTSLEKNASLYCAIDMPKHLKYLTGWSRVSRELPKNFDLSIIVDTQAASLLEHIDPGDLSRLKAKPIVIIDHHESEATIDFASLIINRKAAATGEIIFDLAKELNWSLSAEAKDMLAISILSDTLGLMSASTTPQTIRVIADLAEQGVNLTHIDNLRRETYRKSLDLTHYKGRLLTRVESCLDGRLSLLVIPWGEIERYSPLYNPPMLVLEDMRLIEGNQVSVALKTYSDGHMTAKIRANEGFPIAAKLAEHFGGGGHPYASGFKTTDYTLDTLKPELIDTVSKLLDEVKNEVI